MRFTYSAFRKSRKQKRRRSSRRSSSSRHSSSRIRKQRGGRSAAMIPDTTLDYLEEQAVIVPTGVQAKNQYEAFEG
jgi:hypothetical protein